MQARGFRGLGMTTRRDVSYPCCRSHRPSLLSHPLSGEYIKLPAEGGEEGASDTPAKAASVFFLSTVYTSPKQHPPPVFHPPLLFDKHCHGFQRHSQGWPPSRHPRRRQTQVAADLHPHLQGQAGRCWHQGRPHRRGLAGAHPPDRDGRAAVPPKAGQGAAAARGQEPHQVHQRIHQQTPAHGRGRPDQTAWPLPVWTP
ncbi:hypothetical protein GQ54DRAFT_157611 [Martensiomyces pterosporus]|nr:hypothetical protein GQ54DRAFT_157611 [Martensiomyces pterosporus]